MYSKKEPARLVRIVGQAPFQATIYELERLRCNLCGDTFTADSPPVVGRDKYDSSAAAMIGLLKYGTGLPFYRLEKLQANAALPLPDSTQWDIVADVLSEVYHRCNKSSFSCTTQRAASKYYESPKGLSFACRPLSSLHLAIPR